MYLHICHEEGLNYVLSERKRVCIKKDTAEKLPFSEFIVFEEDQYRVFYNELNASFAINSGTPPKPMSI